MLLQDMLSSPTWQPQLYQTREEKNEEIISKFSDLNLTIKSNTKQRDESSRRSDLWKIRNAIETLDWRYEQSKL